MFSWKKTPLNITFQKCCPQRFLFVTVVVNLFLLDMSRCRLVHLLDIITLICFILAPVFYCFRDPLVMPDWLLKHAPYAGAILEEVKQNNRKLEQFELNMS